MATKSRKRGLVLVILGATSICVALGVESLARSFAVGSPGLMYYLTLAAGLSAIVYGAIQMRTGGNGRPNP
jgi:hypothetical protein